MRSLGTVATLFASIILLIACNSDSNDTNGVVLNDQVPKIIGTVFNATNNQPIRDAIISTQPPTQEVSTGLDGTFELAAPTGSGGSFLVFADHLAYRSQQKRITVLNGETATADFSMQSAVNGLVASPSTLTLSGASPRDTVRLTSTAPNTGFSVQVSDPWITVSPSAGMIVNGETLFLDIAINPEAVPVGGNANAELVINADNGLAGAFVNVLVEQGEILASNGVNTSRQSDCRRPDIFRIAFDRPGASLVQFAPSAELNADAIITRTFELPDNPLLVDSIVVPELGTATITHVENGPEHTVMELFELSPDDEVISITSDGDFDVNGGRAGIEIALLQGVYCFYLAPTTGEFTAGTTLSINYGFQRAQ
jgi:hypothetical protein